ncbi:MAG: class I SAM-dependent methyltransferase [Chitinophagaceae bacterium]|nr:class I SAM-dependent methyltransferase [Chitinophagaceae bacterium]
MKNSIRTIMQESKEQRYKAFAEQLRHPNGMLGKDVAGKMNKGNRLMNLEAIKELRLSENDQVLEIGMGNGFFVNDILLSDKSIKYFGCDTSLEMVDESILLNAKWVQSGRALFLRADAHHVPFQDGLFDKIFTVNTIYFWQDATKVLSGIKRTLKDNGLLIVSMRPKQVMEQMPVTKYGFNLFTHEDVAQLLADNGFEVIQTVEKDDEDVKMDDIVIKNAYVVITAIKSK